MVTILVVALFQMSQLTLNPAIDTVVGVFPGRSIADVQEAFALLNFVLPISGIVSALLINRGLLTKRAAILLGLVLLGCTGALSLVLHTEFWHLRLLSVVFGLAAGLYIVNIASVFFDNFSDEERQPIAGYQTSCINGGGIVWGLAGGTLCSLVWYGGYLVFLLAFPVAILAYFTVPKVPRVKPQKRADAPRVKIKPMVYYYCVILGLFMMLYSVGGSNISTHLTQAGVSNPALAGVAAALQMAGGVCCGMFFGKLSPRLGDLLMAVSCLALVVGFCLLGLFPGSIVIAMLAVFIAGMSLSCTAPRVMFTVSTLSNAGNSAMSSALSTSVAPSLGGFISPYIFTRVTLALFGESTGKRYLFTAAVAAVFGVAIVIATLSRRRRGLTDTGEPIT
jgi:MFS family permease